MFHTTPYECDEEDQNMAKTIGQTWEAIKKYNPEMYGFQWAQDAGRVCGNCIDVEIRRTGKL